MRQSVSELSRKIHSKKTIISTKGLWGIYDHMPTAVHTALTFLAPFRRNKAGNGTCLEQCPLAGQQNIAYKLILQLHTENSFYKESHYLK